MKSKGDPKRKPRAALANPADPLEVGTDREALIGAKPELRPCRFEIRPVDAESLADDQRLGHPLALSPRIIPAAVGIVLVDLVFRPSSIDGQHSPEFLEYPELPVSRTCQSKIVGTLVPSAPGSASAVRGWPRRPHLRRISPTDESLLDVTDKIEHRFTFIGRS